MTRKRRIANTPPTPGPRAAHNHVGEFDGLPAPARGEHPHLYIAATWTLIISLAVIGSAVVVALSP